MNILLLDGLPYDYKETPLSADFRNMINADLILHDPEIPDEEKTFLVLNQLFENIPNDIQQAIDGFSWFFSRGQHEDKEGVGKSKSASQKGFDFEQDANTIYAAFYATYNISLTTIDFLHWWEFMALFEGLPETTHMKQIIYWRTADLAGMPKREKKHILKMRKLVALKNPDKKVLSVEEINQQTKDRVMERFEQVRRQQEGEC